MAQIFMQVYVPKDDDVHTVKTIDLSGDEFSRVVFTDTYLSDDSIENNWAYVKDVEVLEFHHDN